MPAALKPIMKDLEIKEVEMGALGSLIFFGLVLGSAAATCVLEVFQYKHTLFVALVMNGLGLLIMTITDSYYLLCFARLLSGFAQIFPTIYGPIYVDCYCS